MANDDNVQDDREINDDKIKDDAPQGVGIYNRTEDDEISDEEDGIPENQLGTEEDLREKDGRFYEPKEDYGNITGQTGLGDEEDVNDEQIDDDILGVVGDEPDTNIIDDEDSDEVFVEDDEDEFMQDPYDVDEENPDSVLDDLEDEKWDDTTANGFTEE